MRPIIDRRNYLPKYKAYKGDRAIERLLTLIEMLRGIFPIVFHKYPDVSVMSVVPMMKKKKEKKKKETRNERCVDT